MSFESPYVNRSVQVVKWDKISRKCKWQYVNEGESDDGWEGGYLKGRIKIGEFELDDEFIGRLSLIQRDLTKKDFTEEEIDAMEEGITVVGIQKGDKLTYCQLDNTLSVKHKIMDKDEFEADGTSSETSPSTIIIFAVLAIFFAVMGVRSLLKNKNTEK